MEDMEKKNDGINGLTITLIKGSVSCKEIGSRGQEKEIQPLLLV